MTVSDTEAEDLIIYAKTRKKWGIFSIENHKKTWYIKSSSTEIMPK